MNLQPKPINKIKILSEVLGALYRATRDTFPGYEEQINEDTVPSKQPLVADREGWAICLRKFEKDVRKPSKLSKVYTHKEEYVDKTRKMKLWDSARFLRDEIVAVLEKK